MTNDTLGIVLIILLIIIMFLVFIGDLLLALIAGLGFHRGRREQVEEEDDGGIEILTNPNGGDRPNSIRVPTSKLPEFFSNMMQKVKQSNKDEAGEKKENEKVTPAGYI